MEGQQELRRRSRVLRRIGAEQERLHADIGTVTAWGQRHPEVFAGTWFDNEAAESGRGPVRIGLGVLRGGDPDELAALRASLEHPDRLVVVPREHTLQALDRLRERVVATCMSGPRRASGTFVSTIGSDVFTNRVLVGISAHDDAFAQQLLARFPGEPLTIEQGVRIVPAAAAARPR